MKHSFKYMTCTHVKSCSNQDAYVWTAPTFACWYFWLQDILLNPSGCSVKSISICKYLHYIYLELFANVKIVQTNHLIWTSFLQLCCLCHEFETFCERGRLLTFAATITAWALICEAWSVLAATLSSCAPTTSAERHKLKHVCWKAPSGIVYCCYTAYTAYRTDTAELLKTSVDICNTNDVNMMYRTLLFPEWFCW